jgi:hypothetical protein
MPAPVHVEDKRIKLGTGQIWRLLRQFVQPSFHAPWRGTEKALDRRAAAYSSGDETVGLRQATGADILFFRMSVKPMAEQREFAVLLSLLVHTSGRAATPQKSRAGEAPPLVDHILVEVSNMKASLALYRDLLGMRVKSDGGDFVMLEAGNTFIALWTKHWDWEPAKSPAQQPAFGMYPHSKVPNAGAVCTNRN